jgi:hypothetical protein
MIAMAAVYHHPKVSGGKPRVTGRGDIPSESFGNFFRQNIRHVVEIE